jgi:SAM-dependent methyltransferase
MKFCKVADIEDWQQDGFQTTASLLQLKRKVRKTWEFIQVYNGLQHLGLLNGQAEAIGLGVGHEPLIYAFTNVCQSVIATDLYESDTWATASMATQQVYQQNPFEYQRDRLTVRHMDMTQIAYPDAHFDFVWSCCSIEHVNNFRELHQVFSEIHRVLKPGGMAALTTEFNPTARHSYEPNMLFTDIYWIDQWLTGKTPLIQGFELLDQPDFHLADLPENQPTPRREGGSIRAITRDIQLTSISFFLRKTGEFSQPYHEDWLAPEISQYLAGCDATRWGNLSAAVECLQPLTQQAIPRQRVAACHRLIAALLPQGKRTEAIAVCKAGMADFMMDTCSDHLMPLAGFCEQLGLHEAAQDLYQRIAQLPGAHVKQIKRSTEAIQEYQQIQERPIQSRIQRLINQANRFLNR